MIMIYGDMRYYANGRKKKYNSNSKAKKVSVPFRELKPSTAYRRDTVEVRSVDTNHINVSKPERMKYTGTLVKGIATMHKSNAVPVIDQQQAEDIARMRRG